jgi:hypothetical protein
MNTNRRRRQLSPRPGRVAVGCRDNRSPRRRRGQGRVIREFLNAIAPVNELARLLALESYLTTALVAVPQNKKQHYDQN